MPGFGCPITVLSVPVANLGKLFDKAVDLIGHVPATSNYVMENRYDPAIGRFRGHALGGTVTGQPLAKSMTRLAEHAEVPDPNNNLFVGIDPTLAVFYDL